MRPIWWPVAVAAVAAPPVIFERMAQYSFLVSNGLFWFFSGQRFPFDIYYLAFATAAVGYFSRDLARSWVANLLAVSILMSFLFVICEPKLCYATGYDGLEPVRVWLFFSTEVLATTYAGTLGTKSAPAPGWAKLLVAGCGFYAIGYDPVIFTLAGVRLLAPFDEVALPIFLAALAFVAIVTLAEDGAALGGVVVMGFLATMLILGLGIAGQYLQQALPIAGTIAIAVTVGVVVGIVASLKGRSITSKVKGSRIPFALLILYVVVAIVIVPPDAAVGYVVVSSGTTYPSSYSSTPLLVAGGLMSSPMVRSQAVAVNVTFASNDVGVITKGNFLGAGIWVHSADCCTDGIDYGYRFDVLLFPNGSESYVADAWKVCDANGGCDGHSWRVLMYHRQGQLEGLYLDSPVTLVIRWVGRTVEWSYSTPSGSHLVGSFLSPPRENAAFNAGWDGPGPTPLPGGANYLQFGVSTLSPLPIGWSVKFECPDVLVNATWGCINHAETVQGGQSYWKALWRWGESLPNVEAVANSTGHSVVFRGANTTMVSFQSLW